MRIIFFFFACLSVNALSAQTIVQNKAAMTAFYAAFNGETSKFDASAFVTPDYVDYTLSPEVWSQLGSNGIERFQNEIVAFKTAFPDVHATVVKTVAEGNTVIAYIEMTGTFKNDFMGIKASGKSFKFMDADIVEFNNAGKSTAHWAVQDATIMWMQLGVKM